MNTIIQTEQLNVQSDELRTVATRLYEISERVLEVQMALFEQTLSDRFAAILQKSAGAVDILAAQTENMGRVLDCIATEYRSCEERAVDNAEGDPYAQITATTIDIRVVPPNRPSGRRDYWWGDIPLRWRENPIAVHMTAENVAAQEFVGW